jgi:hypothetical protein
MISLLNSFWLIITNAVLGILVVAGVVAIVILAIRELQLRAKYEHSKRIDGALRTFVSRHGITMADGGTPLDQKEQKPSKRSRRGNRKKL